MKKVITTLFAAFIVLSAQAQTQDYKIMKIDVFNLMGVGIQKFNLSYEVSAFEQMNKQFPTLQLNASVPFNAMNSIDINYGLEFGAQLKFYMAANSVVTKPEGFYLGFKIDGGWVNYTRSHTYMRTDTWDDFRTYDFEINRIRTSIGGTVGMQARLTKRLFFDAEMGIGFSNINAQATEFNVDPGYEEAFWMDEDNEVLYQSYTIGKYVAGYFPFAISLGYNLAN